MNILAIELILAVLVIIIGIIIYSSTGEQSNLLNVPNLTTFIIFIALIIIVFLMITYQIEFVRGVKE